MDIGQRATSTKQGRDAEGQDALQHAGRCVSVKVTEGAWRFAHIDAPCGSDILGANGD